MSDKLKNFWQKDLNELKENPLRFGGLLICFIAAVALFFSDDSGGEQVNIAENPAPVENVENVETPAPVANDKKVVAVKNAKNSSADKNITVVLGANSEELVVHDPFKVPQKEKIETPSPAEIPTVQPVIIPPVAQEQPKLSEKFILRGTAIVGYKKSALIQMISNDKNSAAENLILEIGDTLGGKKIIDISQDFLTFDDGEILFIDLQSP